MRKITLAVIAVMIFAASAYAAVSSPCSGYKKPAAAPAPSVPSDYRRDVLDERVPVQTEETGTVYKSKATEDREYMPSGK